MGIAPTFQWAERKIRSLTFFMELQSFNRKRRFICQIPFINSPPVISDVTVAQLSRAVTRRRLFASAGTLVTSGLSSSPVFLLQVVTCIPKRVRGSARRVKKFGSEAMKPDVLAALLASFYQLSDLLLFNWVRIRNIMLIKRFYDRSIANTYFVHFIVSYDGVSPFMFIRYITKCCVRFSISLWI